MGIAGLACHECATMDVGANLDQKCVARPNEPLAGGKRRQMKWATGCRSAGRSFVLLDMRLSPKPREGAVKNLCCLKRLRKVYPPRDELLVVGDRDDQPTRVFNWCGEVRILYRFKRNLARTRMVVAAIMPTITGCDTQGMRKAMLIGREAGFFDRRRCVQVVIMPIVGVSQEGCAAECPQNQDRDQHRREHATSPLRPNNSVQGRAAAGGWAARHRPRGYRSGSNPSMTVSEPRIGRFPIKVEFVTASHRAREARLD